MSKLTNILKNLKKIEKKTQKIRESECTKVLGISRQITRAINTYMNDASINHILRHDRSNSETDNFLRLFDIAFNTVDPIEEDMIVFRGIKPPEDDDGFPGFYGHDKGYVSTSASIQVPKFFMGETCCFQIIIVPKGTRVLFLPNNMGNLFKTEEEILLNRGARFELLEEGTMQSDEDDDILKVVLLKYIPSKVDSHTKEELFKLYLLDAMDNIIEEANNLKLKDEDIRFKNFLLDIPNTCQIVTRTKLKEYRDFVLDQLLKRLRSPLNVNIITYTCFFVFFTTFPQYVLKDDDTLPLEDIINIKFVNYIEKIGKTKSEVWKFAFDNFYRGHNSLLMSLFRTKYPNFRLSTIESLNKPSLEDLETIYALHPIPNDFMSLWNVIFYDKNENYLQFVVKYQIPINPFLPFSFTSPNLEVVVYVSSLPYFKPQMIKPLEELWEFYITSQFKLDEMEKSRIQSRLQMFTIIDVLINAKVPFVHNRQIDHYIQNSNPKLKAKIEEYAETNTLHL